MCYTIETLCVSEAPKVHVSIAHQHWDFVGNQVNEAIKKKLELTNSRHSTSLHTR